MTEEIYHTNVVFITQTPKANYSNSSTLYNASLLLGQILHFKKSVAKLANE